MVWTPVFREMQVGLSKISTLDPESLEHMGLAKVGHNVAAIPAYMAEDRVYPKFFYAEPAFLLRAFDR